MVCTMANLAGRGEQTPPTKSKEAAKSESGLVGVRGVVAMCNASGCCCRAMHKIVGCIKTSKCKCGGAAEGVLPNADVGAEVALADR